MSASPPVVTSALTSTAATVDLRADPGGTPPNDLVAGHGSSGQEPVARTPRAVVRRRVLDAAAAEFAERGYADASMATIARRAGFTKGAVYSNFDSKHSLLADVLLERAVDAIRTALDRLTEGGSDGRAGREMLAARGARVLAEEIGREQRWLILAAELAVQAARDPEARTAYQRYRHAQRGALAASLRRNAAALGLVEETSLDRAAIALLAVLSGLAMEVAASPGTLREPDLVAILTEVLAGLIGDTPS